MALYNNPIIKTEADKIRQEFIDNGVDYSDITQSDFFRLVSYVCEELELFNKLLDANPDMYGIRTMKLSTELKRNMPQCTTFRNKFIKGFIKVDSHYFRGREAISFNEDGFIGIAGWASNTNEIPFIKAMKRWVEELIIIKNVRRNYASCSTRMPES